MHGPDEAFTHVPHITATERTRSGAARLADKQEQSWLMARR